MAGTFRPSSSQLKTDKEGKYIIHNYSLFDPAESLFTGGTNVVPVAPFKGTTVRTAYDEAYWFNVTDFLDIEFLDDVNIWDVGTEYHKFPLDVYISDNGVAKEKVGIIEENQPLDVNNWKKVGTFKKGRYIIKIQDANSPRISHEWYLEVVLPPSKILLLKNSEYFYYDVNKSQWLTIGSLVTEQDYLNYGMDDLSIISKEAWSELNGEIQIKHYSGDALQESSSLLLETDPFSVYDYISESPQVIIYTESTDDITVSTTTDPFDIYDEFGDSVEALYYTGDETATEADLILEANWSQIDELDGDFEVVTWTDEPQETAQRVLEMTAIPKPQFIKLVNSKSVYSVLESILSNDVSVGYRDEARYFVTGLDTTKWYVWDKNLNKFVTTDISTHEMITKNGMKHTDINNITQAQWNTWSEQHINVGIFLKDNPRDTITSIVENISYKDYLPRNTSEIEKASFYILNTTAKIDLQLIGNTLEGVLSDDDLTRVQYRVILNGKNYYPSDGSFTKLSPSPQNIAITISGKDVMMDEQNTLRVEFQDFFGAVDYWQTTFIGTYSGLMFKSINGDYYSTEVGEVLKYLDFSTIIAGQTTIEHEVILKNQYGYDVKNLDIYAIKDEFPEGMSLQFAKSLNPFTPESNLLYDSLANNEELSFYLRIKTELGVTPNANGKFDIRVIADRV